MELSNLPHGLHECDGVRQVADWYAQSFKEIRACEEPNTVAKEARFAELIKDVHDRHGATVVTMASGVMQLREKLGLDVNASEWPKDVADSIYPFLDRFFSSRYV